MFCALSEVKGMDINMKNYNFRLIKEKVLEWGQQYIISGTDFISLTKNEDDVLIFDLTFCNCLAQIVVCDTCYAPYKNVSFEAMTINSKKAIESGQPDLIYFFYDSEDMVENEVLEELNVGVEYCLNYIPNQLGEMYINKKGILNIDSEKMNRIVHPDDLKKVKKEFLVGKFVCTDVQFQYLVVENDLLSIRILPRVFRIMLNEKSNSQAMLGRIEKNY